MYTTLINYSVNYSVNSSGGFTEAIERNINFETSSINRIATSSIQEKTTTIFHQTNYNLFTIRESSFLVNYSRDLL